MPLWPNGAPNDNGMRAQARDGALYVAEPTLTVFPAGLIRRSVSAG